MIHVDVDENVVLVAEASVVAPLRGDSQHVPSSFIVHLCFRTINMEECVLCSCCARSRSLAAGLTQKTTICCSEVMGDKLTNNCCIAKSFFTAD